MGSRNKTRLAGTPVEERREITSVQETQEDHSFVTVK